ncbi:MAG: response regulator transcription factor [Blastocatellia bacterium]
MEKIRVFLVDDHTVLRLGLQVLIHSQPDMQVVGQASNGLDAVAQVQRLLPQVVVMDISLPQLDGGTATERITQSCPEVRVLALTRHLDTVYLRRLLQAGASGYVLKQTAADDVISAIRKVAHGEKYLDPPLVERMVEDYVGRAPNPNQPTALLVELTEREIQIIRLVAWGESNKEIAAQLNLSVKTVEFHKARAMGKLGLHSRPEIVRYALLLGWLRNEAPSE